MWGSESPGPGGLNPERPLGKVLPQRVSPRPQGPAAPAQDPTLLPGQQGRRPPTTACLLHLNFNSLDLGLLRLPVGRAGAAGETRGCGTENQRIGVGPTLPEATKITLQIKISKYQRGRKYHHHGGIHLPSLRP